MNTIQEIALYLQAQDAFTIMAHVSPDGDTLGSSLALFCALGRMGKKVQVVCENPVPAIYAFLPGADAVLLPEQAESLPNAISVDCAAQDRLGKAAPLFSRAVHTINIDHHVTNPLYADMNYVEEKAAVGEIMYTLLVRLGQMDRAIATCLYTAIMTDTGNFSYANTTADTYRTAALLVEAGADNAAVNRAVYRTVPYRKIKLLGAVLNSVQLYCEGRLGVATITQADLARAGATSEDVEGIIDYVRDIDTVELAVLVRESSLPNTGKISLRSKNYANVCSIGARMGGGGHRRAAGYTDHGEFSAICARAVDMARAALEQEEEC